MKTKMVSLFLAMALSPLHFVYADPAENQKLAIPRTANSPLVIQGELSKNEYRVEMVDVPYTERVPYQDTEEYTERVPYQESERYTEQVPYQETEYYQDTETYYENERRCEQHTVYDRQRVCRTETDYEQECRNEPVCHHEKDPPVCSVERICRTDHTGRDICIDKEVCRSVGTGRDVCTDNRVCRNIPRTREVCDWVTTPRTEERCDYVSVPRQRTVTKSRSVTRYREETRTRTVTRYRDETRTRTVTRYRNEERCCRSEPVDVFDHQWKVAVQLRFPAEAQLVGDESETITAELGGTERSPRVAVNVKSKVLKYKLANENLAGGVYTADLVIVPMHKAADLGKSTIMNLKLNSMAQNPKIVFADAGLRNRVVTQYDVRVVDATTQTIVATAQATAGPLNKVEIPLASSLSPTTEYEITLGVARSGINLDQPIAFEIQAKHKVRRYTAEELGKKTVSELRIGKIAEGATLVRFKDLGVVDNVETRYVLDVIEERTALPIQRIQVKAEEVINENSTVAMTIPAGIMNDDVDYIVKVRVGRQGAVLDQPVAFEIQDTIIALDLAQYSDLGKISPASVLGRGKAAVLVFTDATQVHESVVTEYKIIIRRKGGLLNQEIKVLANGSVLRKQLTTNAAGQLQIPLQMLGVSNETLDQYVKKNKPLWFEVTVERKGAKLPSPISILKKSEGKVK